MTANPWGKLLADAARLRETRRPFDVGVGLLSLGDREAQFWKKQVTTTLFDPGPSLAGTRKSS
ncbi:hypothetical protein J7F02_29585 [Streptomyces sp. ISL-112]|uniref:hypothetical protein n=1 Tax=unclassified Streptomyces TaxID=2593676 RepID=UPI001BEB2085|nr:MULTISPECIES: hypothetical protein [unclassified Streptomyces]MBT2429644.1 hypothetical protein [Streptomyces sp. ISL-112]MBT2464862.1 hypothetical protein [Streptomyces sp. ISL-63]